jgi:RimJ/RimL family protein N-acetyltransferase
MPWAKADVSVEETERNSRLFRAKYLLCQDFVIAVLSPDEKELLGGTGFHPRNAPLTARSAEVGMWIAGSRAHQGLGTRVLHAMLDWGFSEWPWQRLEWRCDPRNIASRRVAEKAGLVLEGTLREDSVDAEGERRSTHIFATLRGRAPSS